MPRGRPKKQVTETKQLMESVSKQQIESIQSVSKLLGSLTCSFNEFEDLNYEQIKSVYFEGNRFHFLFKEVIHND